MKNIILLAEDDPDDVFFFTCVLKASGVINPLIVLRDGAETVAYLIGEGRYGDREKYPLPAILVLDLKMPRVDGLGVLQRVQTQPELDGMLTIVLTHLEDTVALREAYSMGANTFLFKPLMKEELDSLIENFPDKWDISTRPSHAVPPPPKLELK